MARCRNTLPRVEAISRDVRRSWRCFRLRPAGGDDGCAIRCGCTCSVETEAGDKGCGLQFLFKVNCDQLLPSEAAKVSKLKKGSTLDIHGFASQEGPAGFNVDLSCHRTNRIVELIRTTRPDCPVKGTFKHGASPVSGPGLY